MWSLAPLLFSPGMACFGKWTVVAISWNPKAAHYRYVGSREASRAAVGQQRGVILPAKLRCNIEPPVSFLRCVLMLKGVVARVLRSMTARTDKARPLFKAL